MINTIINYIISLIWEFTFIKTIRITAKNAIWTKTKQEVEDKLRIDLRDQVESEIQEVMVPVIKSKISDDIRSEICDEIRDEVKDDIRSETWVEIRDEVKHDIRSEMWEEIRDEVKEDIRIEIWEDVRDEIKEDIHLNHGEIIISELKNDMTPVIHRELRKEFYNDVHKKLVYQVDQFRKNLRPKVIDTLRKELYPHVIKDIRTKYYNSKEMKDIRVKAKGLARVEFSNKVKEDHKINVIEDVYVKINQECADYLDDIACNFNIVLALSTAKSWVAYGWTMSEIPQEQWVVIADPWLESIQEYHNNNISSCC